ncbi:unnamed protein product [Heligmosomoides polygyrus]|uniref:ATP-dependent DNA helicase n=1 Tax=Heligmosomoides polygyrus TaxID=6339 RepID=A0A183FW59_HELPZ|nr:unnamed protein product [Heligmosomoides polygyrus]
MAPKYALEAVDKLLKGITELQLPFGGKAIILCGDFRQIPLLLWLKQKDPKFGTFRSRVPHCGLISATSNGGIDWSNFLIQLGNGELQNHSNEVQVSDDLPSSGDIVDDTFSDTRTLKDMIERGRAILTVKNFDSLEINNKRGIDEVINDETIATDNTEYSLEFLNSLTPQGYPPHELHLKKGALVMLLRNLRVSQGLHNGTRLTIKRMDRYILGCKIATGTNKGQYFLIPSIIFCLPVHDTSPCRFKRRQFPLRLASAMTINKSQGQTFDKVGVYLPSPVISHGQLYVACSRVRQKFHLKIWLIPGLKTIPK